MTATLREEFFVEEISISVYLEKECSVDAIDFFYIVVKSSGWEPAIQNVACHDGWRAEKLSYDIVYMLGSVVLRILDL